MIIQLNLKGQVLTAIAPDLAEQSINKLFCSISADEEWDGLAIRLVFRSINKLGIVARQAVVTDRTAVPVPPEVVRPGVLFINAIGVADNGSVQLTTGDMDEGLRIKTVSALTAAAAEAITPTEYNELLSLIGDLSLIDIEDAGSVAAVLLLILANMGAVSNLDTVNKDNLVDAINEVLKKAGAGSIPLVSGVSNDGISYSASGDDLPAVTPGSKGTQVGKGKQIVFVPYEINTTAAPTLSLNGGVAVPIRVRAARNQGEDSVSPNATLPVPVGALMRGVPYTMTFCGTYWLVDSFIGAETEQQAALMREFSAKAVSILDADAVGVPVVNSMDDIVGNIGIARIIRSAEEESEQDAAGNVTIPSVGTVEEMLSTGGFTASAMFYAMDAVIGMEPSEALSKLDDLIGG